MRIWPNGNTQSPGRVTNEFGTNHKLTNWHHGIDLVGFDWVQAADSGRVILAGPNGTAGNEVRIRHDDGYITRYLHLAPGTIRVGVGQRVDRGHLVGKMGWSGYVIPAGSAGKHLHFEVIAPDGSTRINPREYVLAGQPAGGNSKPFVPNKDSHPEEEIIEEEEDDMPKNSAVYYESPKGSNTWTYLVFNYGSGLFHKFGNGKGAGKMPAAYNNAVSTAFDTTTWAEVTEGHGKVIEASLTKG